MQFALDHVVIAVHDLDRAIQDYRARGFTVVPGGEHPGRPTHNALVVFNDGSYFELIAWRSPAPGERWWELLQQHGEGLVDFAVRPEHTARAVAVLKALGVAYDGPQDGGRLRPDGERLRWQTARPPSHDQPFFCGDVTPRVLRVPEGAVRQHANGATGIVQLKIAVHDLGATLLRYQALLGLATLPTIGPDTHGSRSARLPLGPSTLVFTEVAATTSPETGRGEGPQEVELAGTGLAFQAAHGAPRSAPLSS